MKKIYPTSVKLACPRCYGLGYLEVDNKIIRDYRPWLREKTKILRNKLRKLNHEGLLKDKTLRQIAKMVGLKSAQQIKHHILMTERIGWKAYE